MKNNQNKLALIISLIALIIVSCSKQKDTNKNVVTEREERVQTTVLNKEKIAQVNEYTAILQSYESVNIAPALSGRIVKIFVEVGSRVNKGDKLIEMDRTQVTTAKLTLSNLEIEYKRVEALFKLGSTTQQAFDQISLQLAQTRENVDFLEKNTYVTAPFSGIISAKNYENGELFSGLPVLVLNELNTLKTLVSIPETFFPLVKNGMKVDIRSDIYKNMIFPSTIEMVYPTIDPSSHTFQIKLKIPNSKELLRPGMYATVTISLGEIESMIVPYQSVLKLQGSNERYVFLNENGKAKRVMVMLGQRFNDKIEIYSNDIKEGSELVIVGQSRLVDGAKLNVIK